VLCTAGFARLMFGPDLVSSVNKLDLMVADAGVSVERTLGWPAFAIPRSNALAYSASASFWAFSSMRFARISTSASVSNCSSGFARRVKGSIDVTLSWRDNAINLARSRSCKS